MPRSVRTSTSQSSLAPSASLTSLTGPRCQSRTAIANVPSKAQAKADHRLTLSVLESARFRLSKEVLGSSSVALVRAQSSASRSSFSTGRTGTSTHDSRASHLEYENPHEVPVDSLDLDDLSLDQYDMHRAVGPSDPPPERQSATAKIYEFFSRSSSHSRSRSHSRSKSTVESDNSHPPSPPPSDMHSSPYSSRTARPHAPHITTSMPTRNPSKPLTRSPSRPLSNQTAMTGSETDKTITPSTSRPNRARPPAHMLHGHRPAPAPPQYANPYIDLDASFSADQAPQIVPNGNRVPNGVQYEYDPRMPPPPVPVPLPAPIEHTKDRKKGPKIFGISLGRGRGRSRPGSPRDTNGAANPSGWAQARRRLFSSPPSISPERHDPSSNIPDAVIAPRPRTAIPQAGGGSVFPPSPSMRIPERSQSSPPRVSPATSTRDETCSPFLGFGIGLPRIFGGRSRAPSRDRERSREKAIWKGKEKERPIVSVPMLRTRTHSKDGRGPGRHASFDFERPPPVLQRSASLTQSPGAGAGAGVVPPPPRASRHPHPAAAASQHARAASRQPHSRSHAQAHARSLSRTRPSPLQANSPLLSHATGASDAANSQSTAATGTTGGTGAGAANSNGGSWGRKAGWLRAGVLPPFAFEPAVSGEGSGRGSPVSDGREQEAKLRDRDRARERERRDRDTRRETARRDESELVRTRRNDPGLGRTRREAATVDEGERIRTRDLGKGKEREKEPVPGRWEEREVDLGLGLAWAPSKIRVREWTGRSSQQGHEAMERAWEREGERRERERQIERERTRDRRRGNGYEQYENRRGAVRREREVTEQFHDVLGSEGFDGFKRYVRRYDENLIHLEGPNGLLARVRLLLDGAPYPYPSERQKRQLLDDLVRIVQENDF